MFLIVSNKFTAQLGPLVLQERTFLNSPLETWVMAAAKCFWIKIYTSLLLKFNDILERMYWKYVTKVYCFFAIANSLRIGEYIDYISEYVEKHCRLLLNVIEKC